MNVILVGIGGFFGSVVRFHISKQTSRKFVATWLANVSGSILLAFIYHFYTTDAVSQQLWLLFGVGFCGAYTTFSTFGHETLQLILHKEYKTATGYVLSSLMISLLFVGIIIFIR